MTKRTLSSLLDVVVLVLSVGTVVSPLNVAQAVPSPDSGLLAPNLEFLGQAIIPTGVTFANTTIGGLSSITYDAGRGVFYSLSDDQAKALRYLIKAGDKTRAAYANKEALNFYRRAVLAMQWTQLLEFSLPVQLRRIEGMDAAVAEVANQQVSAELPESFRGERQSPRRVQLAPRSDAPQKVALRIERIDIAMTLTRHVVHLVRIL